jgi:hypothetical protein
MYLIIASRGYFLGKCYGYILAVFLDPEIRHTLTALIKEESAVKIRAVNLLTKALL